MMICTKLVSFPTRERGLKLKFNVIHPRRHMSFPTRERGLKLAHKQDDLLLRCRRSLRGNVD